MYPRESKCDLTGEIWGDKPSYHHYADQLGNAFAALARLELRVQVKGNEARRATPLFLDNERRPVSPSLANLILDAMLLTFLTTSVAFRYTWHSFRIGLATRLHRADVSDSDIQAICRWQSTESLKICIKMTAEDYLSKLSKAHGQQGELGSHPACPIDSSSGFGIPTTVAEHKCSHTRRAQPTTPMQTTRAQPHERCTSRCSGERGLRGERRISVRWPAKARETGALSTFSRLRLSQPASLTYEAVTSSGTASGAAADRYPARGGRRTSHLTKEATHGRGSRVERGAPHPPPPDRRAACKEGLQGVLFSNWSQAQNGRRNVGSPLDWG